MSCVGRAALEPGLAPSTGACMQGVRGGEESYEDVCRRAVMQRCCDASDASAEHRRSTCCAWDRRAHHSAAAVARTASGQPALSHEPAPVL
eukprot:scaffold31771_cov129-Isochrysis_galbana.AAC.4